MPNPNATSSATALSDADLPELSPTELAEVVRQARIKKRQQEFAKSYAESLNAPRPMPTAEQLAAYIISETKRDDRGDDGRQLNPRYLGPNGYNIKRTPTLERFFWLLCYYFTNDPRFENAAEQFPECKGMKFNLRKGLAIFGPAGCGKTTLFKIFTANPRESYTVIRCLAAAEQFKKHGDVVFDALSEKSDVYNSRFGQTRGGRCYDDLGREPIPVSYSKHYEDKRNLFADLIDRRYDHGPEQVGLTHLTTNLVIDQIETNYGQRVRSRLREMCNVLAFPPDAPDLRE